MEAGRIYSQSSGGADAVVCGQAGSLHETLSARRSAGSAASAHSSLRPGRAVFLLVGIAHRIVEPTSSVENESIVLACHDIDDALKVLPGLPAQTPVALGGSARPLYQARLTLDPSAHDPVFGPLVQEELTRSRQVRALARSSHGSVLARRLIETVTGAFHVKAGPALVRELADGVMARAWAYGKMIPFLHRDGKDDAFVAPCAWAYRLNETKFTLRFGYRVLAVDRHRGGLDVDFSRCMANGDERTAEQALRLN
jgi:hypothetical protein